jgi:hypothetical protein
MNGTGEYTGVAGCINLREQRTYRPDHMGGRATRRT